MHTCTRKWNPSIDWNMYPKFVQEQGLSFRETDPKKKYNNENELQPLWKRLPENINPVLITATASIPKQQPISGDTKDDGSLIFRIAWAVDQDGFVLGVKRSFTYHSLLEQAYPDEEQKDSTKSEDSNDGEESTTKGEDEASTDDAPDELDFSILPGETKHVRFYVVYGENPLHAGKEEKNLKALLYEGESHDIEKVVTVQK